MSRRFQRSYYLRSSISGGSANIIPAANTPPPSDGSEGYEDQFEEEVNDEDERTFKRVAISGFADKENNFANIIPFEFFHEHPAFAESVICVTDDAKFARKRFSSPKTVYSGFIDTLNIVEAKNHQSEDYKRALEGVDAWLAFNLTFSLLKNYAEVAIENKIQRVLFAVAANRTEYGLDITYPEITSLLDQHHINYTIVKFFPPSNIRAGPYRIVKGESRLPRPGEWNRFWTLSPKDLFEIVTFIFPNPDSYNKVYGVGPGGILDENALVQMRSQGWPRPLQVGQFLHVSIEDIEQNLLEKWDEAEKQEKLEATKKLIKAQQQQTFKTK